MSREERIEYNHSPVIISSAAAAADGDDVILGELRASIHYTILQILSIVPLFFTHYPRQQLRNHSLANINKAEAGRHSVSRRRRVIERFLVV